MKKNLFLSIVYFLLIFTGFQTAAETVFEDELLRAGGDDTIVFKNYSGPHKKIDTIEQILGIGRFLGVDIDRSPGEFSYFAKYSIIHAVDYTTTEGLDADILVLSEQAAVDHINNLRRIIAGYLESAYDYGKEQAETLSIFITVYNAVHRGDMPYFEETYKEVVTSSLSPGKAGLALSWEDWPGATMIVIPLTPRAGTSTIGDLDSDVLSGAEVIERLREDEGQGIDVRREIVEIKEDEILEQRGEIDEERSVLDEREQELTEIIAEIEADDDGAETGQAIAEAEEELEAIAETRSVLDERERQIEEREERVVAERENIAGDQMDEISRETPAAQPAADPDAAEDSAVRSASAEPQVITFLMLSGASGSYKGQLMLIEVESGKVIKRSDVDSIRLRGYIYDQGEIVSVAGETGGNRIISIVRIDPENLEIVQSGTAEVYIDSTLVKSGGNYYAVVKSDGRWKAGLFNKRLELVKVSNAEVYPATEIYLSGDDLLVQTPDGRVLSLGPDDFTAAD